MTNTEIGDAILPAFISWVAFYTMARSYNFKTGFIFTKVDIDQIFAMSRFAK